MSKCIIHINEDYKLVKPAVARKFFDALTPGLHELLARKASKRSNNQNAYYWGCVIELIRERMIELGNDVDSEDVHNYLKDRFNSKELFSKEGTLIGSVGASTTKLNKGEFELYLDKIKHFAAEVLDLYVPDPQQPVQMFNEPLIAERDNISNLTVVSRCQI